MDELDREDLVREVDRLVEELLDAAGVKEPPVNAIALAQDHLGLVVALDKGETQRARTQRRAGAKHIYLRPEPREERHQWTVSLAIGEHVLPELLARLGMEPGSKPSFGESLPKLFAQRLLAPTMWFSSDAPSLRYDVPALKARYSTSSHEVLALRLLDLPEGSVITIVDNDRVSKRRSNAWRVTKSMSKPEKKCQQMAHETGETHSLQEAGWSVTCWPVHELDWKREILRSVKHEE